jgi:hypothetical protein
MEHLDVLIWTTSPEKYADKRFYELLDLAPKAEQNYYFVLNKVDLLFEGGSLERGYEQMTSVAGAFQQHIRDNGISDPLLYMISSQEGLTPDALSTWNQFSAFRKQLFQQRDVKQITAIKAANLDVEVQRLQSLFQEEILNLKAFEEILGGAVQELEQQRSAWIQSGQEAIDLWLSNQIRQDILWSQGDPSKLVGPGYSLAMLFQAWQRRFAGERGTSSAPATFTLPEDIAASFRRRLQWTEDWLNHRILRQNLPASFRERLTEILDVKKTSQDLEERLSHAVSLRASAPFLPSFFGFKALQALTYFLLFAFLLFAIGGETAWRGVLDDPGASSLFRLILSSVDTVFSTRGLAALGSYGLLNLFFAFRFYRRYKKLLGSATQRLIESLREELNGVWAQDLDRAVQILKGFRSEIQSQIGTFSSLREDRNG